MCLFHLIYYGGDKFLNEFINQELALQFKRSNLKRWQILSLTIPKIKEKYDIYFNTRIRLKENKISGNIYFLE